MSRTLVAVLALHHALQSPLFSQSTESKSSRPVQVEVSDLQGKPQQDLVKVTNARYYVWHDSNGWHLRTAAKGFVKFDGAITLEGGSFGKLRPVGLDTRARTPDRWAVDEKRTEIRFELHTGGSFDGFDFDVRGADEATLTFDLKMGQRSIRRHRRIFMGRESKTPESTHFVCSARP